MKVGEIYHYFGPVGDTVMKIDVDTENQIIEFLYYEFGVEGRKFFQEVYDTDGDLISIHHGAGTQVRNMIRKRFPDVEPKLNNLDDYYMPWIMAALSYKSVPQESVNRLDVVD